MQNTNDRNSDIDDISVNTNLKVFNGGLGLIKNQKREQNYNHQIKNESSKLQKFSKEYHAGKEMILKEPNSNYTNTKIKESNLEKENYIEAEGIISFRSKKVNKNNEKEESNPDLNLITNGLINKLDRLHQKSTKKDSRNKLASSLNNSNTNEEKTINKIFKLNEERETEKEIKNFEKESQRIQSRILAGNPLESSSSEFSEEEYEKYEGLNTKQIRRTLDDINLKNINKKGKFDKNNIGNFCDNKPVNNYNKNYNTISGTERINLNNNLYEETANSNNSQYDSVNINEKNIFWNLKGNYNNKNNIDLENEQNNNSLAFERSNSAIGIEYNRG